MQLMLGLCCSCIHFDNVDGDQIVDNMLSRVFLNNRQLKSLSLISCSFLTAACFFDLNASIVEEITLIGDFGIRLNYLTERWPYLKKIHKLEFEV